MGLGKYFGPATLVAAAFIGPGTVTVCTLAGVSNGYQLLWALLFSIIATIVLQEMAARLGYVTQKGLGATIRNNTSPGFQRIIFFAIVLSAIVIGNAAYEAGNISGAVLGVDVIFGGSQLWPLLIGIIAFAVLVIGRYALLEKFLIAIVILMSICFVITAILLKPNIGEILAGFIPQKIGEGDFLLILGLIGTTVVPYNLFLHASAVSEKWKRDGDDVANLSDIRKENYVSILLGGIISIAVVIVSATALSGTNMEIKNAGDMALQLEPVLGSWAKIVLAIGLFAAGISSAITAPLAAAYAARGLFDWGKDAKHIGFRGVWMSILLIGIIFSSIGIKPITIIKFAQIANGLLLPIIAAYLIYLMNKKEILGEHKNSILNNILGGGVFIITLFLSMRMLNSVFGFL